MTTSQKVKSIINDQISADINSALECQKVSSLNYTELLDILVEVSKLEALNQTEES
mgnify:CR=1 FL=1|tara:strand:- start:374 stop:541 length:168 start_codon:yes stop_codon:yes gene_type:complete